MTEFKITEAGFYKNRNGEKVEIVCLKGFKKDIWLDKDNFDYKDDGRFFIDENKKSGCDIVAKWEDDYEIDNKTPVTFWLVWTPNGHNPSRKHETQEDAQTEAIRLLNKHPDRKFYVMELSGVAEAKIEYQYNSTF